MITGPRETVKHARKLRSEMSLPERKLWTELRQRPGNFKFRRQHPAGDYVLDFYCASVRLAIEVDGIAHNSASVSARDTRRSAWLRSQGIATTRIPAKIILDDVEPVVVRIVEICRERTGRGAFKRPVPLHHAAHGPPPPEGED
ncbi:endonuclease domain-containing protein [Aurantiacibacter suaedae]|uniref:endonuclease domain-containing protein n=1 Tax=Aurantiacibacter suaedae TaxID=2545755 RepID=UPI0010F63920|nr:endonuclease domain-containing protein [Aurantiacibacter suaedae]